MDKVQENSMTETEIKYVVPETPMVRNIEKLKPFKDPRNCERSSSFNCMSTMSNKDETAASQSI